MDLTLLGTPRLGFSRLARLIWQLSTDPTAATYRSVWGERAAWQLPTQLLAQITNATQLLVWQNTADARARNPQHQPKPILPPWAKDDTEADGKWRGDALPIDEWAERLGWAEGGG